MKTKILEKFKTLYGEGAACYASPGSILPPGNSHL